MPAIWDYDIEELKKTEWGRRLILERLVNYGPSPGEKINLQQVKENWELLDLEPKRRRLMEFLIWGN